MLPLKLIGGDRQRLWYKIVTQSIRLGGVSQIPT